jgi:hypothetical protein
MVKKTEEYYICDRCNIKMERPMVGCDLAGWVALNWTDLCCSCNFHLENLVKDEQKKQRKTRAKL